MSDCMDCSQRGSSCKCNRSSDELAYLDRLHKSGEAKEAIHKSLSELLKIQSELEDIVSALRQENFELKKAYKNQGLRLAEFETLLDKVRLEHGVYS